MIKKISLAFIDLAFIVVTKALTSTYSTGAVFWLDHELTSGLRKGLSQHCPKSQILKNQVLVSCFTCSCTPLGDEIITRSKASPILQC